MRLTRAAFYMPCAMRGRAREKKIRKEFRGEQPAYYDVVFTKGKRLSPKSPRFSHESPRLSVFSAEVSNLYPPSTAGINDKAIAPRLERGLFMTLLELLPAYAQASEAHDRPALSCARLVTAVVCFVGAAQHAYRFHQHVRACEAVFGELRQCCELPNLNASQMMANDVSTLQERSHRGRHGKGPAPRVAEGVSTKVTSETTRASSRFRYRHRPDNKPPPSPTTWPATSPRSRSRSWTSSRSTFHRSGHGPTAPSGPIVPCTSSVALSAGLHPSPSPSSWCPDMLNTKVMPMRSKTCWACPSSAACLLSREVMLQVLANLGVKRRRYGDAERREDPMMLFSQKGSA